MGTLDTPLKNVETRPNETVRPARHRCSSSARRSMMMGQILSIATPSATAVAIVTPIYLAAVGTINLLNLDAETARIAIGTSLAVWILLIVIVASQISPLITLSFGCHRRSMMLGSALVPESMGIMFKRMRIWLILLACCPLLCCLLSYFLLETNTNYWGLPSEWNPLLLVALGLFLCGFATLSWGQSVFLSTRGRKLKHWLKHCWRGVALRSFIPQWDNQFRPIFESCRASRRLATAYRSIKMGAAGCYSAAGCIAAMTIGESILGIALAALSIAAILSVWPTAKRIVGWTKSVVDPVTSESRDDEELAAA